MRPVKNGRIHRGALNKPLCRSRTSAAQTQGPAPKQTPTRVTKVPNFAAIEVPPTPNAITKLMETTAMINAYSTT